jgi:hypothetical protein
VVTFLVAVCGVLGITVSPEEQETLIQGLVGLGSVVGLILTIVGRFTAKKKIGKPEG